MIRKAGEEDIDRMMEIWLDTNVKAHNFIPESYWKNNFELVKKLLPQAELYVYEDEHEIQGFVGLSDCYIEGIFVTDRMQSRGIGRQLLDYLKNTKQQLTLCVYQDNIGAVKFYQREHFIIQSEGIEESTGKKEYSMAWKSARMEQKKKSLKDI